MNGFEKRREQKKECILDALTDLIMTRNFKEIGVREIAKCAGVSPSSIYNFFGSKEELAKQVIYRHMKKIRQDITNKLNESLNFKDQIKVLYGMLNQNLPNNEGLKNLMFDDPDFKKHFEEHIHEITSSILVKVIEQGREEGEISEAISTRTIIMFLNCIIETMSNPAIKDHLDPELRKEFYTLFFYGLLGQR